MDDATRPSMMPCTSAPASRLTPPIQGPRSIRSALSLPLVLRPLAGSAATPGSSDPTRRSSSATSHSSVSRLLPSSSSCRQRASPGTCSAAAQDELLRPPIASPLPPRTCSSNAQDPRRPIACSAAAKDVLVRRPRPAHESACSTVSQDVLLRHPGPGLPPPGLCGIYPLPPPKICAATTQDLHAPGSQAPGPRVPAAPGPRAQSSSSWTSSSSSFSYSSASCCWSPLVLPPGGPLLVLLLVRRSAGLLAFSHPVSDLACFVISSTIDLSIALSSKEMFEKVSSVTTR
ncbi:hypothetical protein ZWY2020_038780 [Hordeum vulgare]|nr:hypothetical protein ZWY2020_038780 [Hordeum vulgare]